MYIKFFKVNNTSGDVMILLCIKIFIARLIDVSLGTFRTINTVKGKNFVASIIGLIEISVWFLVVKEALNTNNNSYLIVFSYALGFSVGTYIGGKISSIFIKTNLEVQIILTDKNDNIINELRKQGYGLTIIDAKGNNNSKYMLYIQIKNKSLAKLKNIIKANDPKALIAVNETKYIENGYFNTNK